MCTLNDAWFWKTYEFVEYVTDRNIYSCTKRFAEELLYDHSCILSLQLRL